MTPPMTSREALARKLENSNSVEISTYAPLRNEYGKEYLDEDEVRLIIATLIGAAQTVGKPLAWHCCDERYPWIQGIVTTSDITVNAWRDSDVKFQPLYPNTPSAEDYDPYAEEVADWCQRSLERAKVSGNLDTRSLVQNVELIIKALRAYSVPSTQQRGAPQGQCDVTMTERFANPTCRCATYAGNKGPCKTFEAGQNGNCVYCDHEKICHESLAASPVTSKTHSGWCPYCLAVGGEHAPECPVTLQMQAPK